MMVTTKTTLSFKMPEEWQLAMKFMQTNGQYWHQEYSTQFVSFSRTETTHMKIKEGQWNSQ